MIYLDEFPELEAIKKVARHDDSVTNRYGRTARGKSTLSSFGRI
jgi:hypothetical protein